MSTQHKCPGCGEETMGYIGSPPLALCSACGKSFRAFLPEEEECVEDPLEELLSMVEVSLSPESSGPYLSCERLCILCAALVRKVRALEGEVASLQDSRDYQRERIGHLQNKHMRGSGP